MKEIYDLLKRLCELEPERWEVQKRGYKARWGVFCKRENQWYCVFWEIWRSTDPYHSIESYKDTLLGGLIEAIEARGWGWKAGSDYNKGETEKFAYTDTQPAKSGISFCFGDTGETICYALLKAYVAALESTQPAERFVPVNGREVKE